MESEKCTAGKGPKGAYVQDGYGLCPRHWNKLFRVDGQGRIWVWCKNCKQEHEVKAGR